MHVPPLLIDSSGLPWRASDCSKNNSLGHSLWLCLSDKKWTPFWFVHNGNLVVVVALDKFPEFCLFCRGRLWGNLAHCLKWRAFKHAWLLKKFRMWRNATGTQSRIFSCFILSTSASPHTLLSQSHFLLSLHPWLIRIIAYIYWVLTCARQWLGICVLLISFSTLTLEDRFYTHLIDKQIGLENKRELATVTWLRKGRSVSIQFPVSLHHPYCHFTFFCLPVHAISCVQCGGPGPTELLYGGVGAYSFLQSWPLKIRGKVCSLPQCQPCDHWLALNWWCDKVPYSQVLGSPSTACCFFF